MNRYFGTSAFRFDDAISGQTVYGNIFDHLDQWGTTASAIGVNSGRDNIYDNNVALDSASSNGGYYDASNPRYHWYNDGASNPPGGLTPVYLAAFPELNHLHDGQGQNFIWRNASLRCLSGLTDYEDNAGGSWQYIANKNSGSDRGFADGSELQTNLNQTLFWNLGLRPIPVTEIGLYDDATRAGWVDNPAALYWQGASGNWDNGLESWSTNAGGAASAAWNTNGYTTAVFAGASGTVTVGAPVSADALVFATGGYTLAGTNPVVLNHPVTLIDQKNLGATINAPLTGLGGIAVAGAGTLTLGGANRYSGVTSVRVGTLVLSGGDHRLPTNTIVTLGDCGPINTGVLKLNGRSQQLAGLWTVGASSFQSGYYAGDRVINGSATPCALTLNIENGTDQFFGTLGGGGANENNFSLLKTGPGKLWFARSLNLSGGVTVAAGTLELHTEFYMNSSAAGVFNLGSNATLAVSGWVDNYTFNNVTINFQSAGGGTLTVMGNGNDSLNWLLGSGMTVRTAGGVRNNFSATSGYGLNLNGNTITLDVARGTDPTADLSVSAPFSNSGGLTKQGNGILRLTAANTYTGSTTISHGTLLVNGSLAGGAVNVTGGALGGTGTISGAVTVRAGARLAPGASIGTLTINNTLTLAAGSRTEVELDDAAGTNDLVRGLTTVNYGGTLVVSNLAGTVTNGQSFKLFSAAAFSGNFSSILVQPPLAGLAAAFNPPSGTLVFGVPVTRISAGASWKYFDRTNDLGTAWRGNSFNDAAWNSGPAMLGFGDANGIFPATAVASNRQWTTYFRRAFYVPNPAQVQSLAARIQRDDGAVVYLNGAEIWRDTNMPAGVITNTTPALSALGGTNESAWLPFSLLPSHLSLLTSGTNLLAIEVHQSATNSSDLAMNFELTGTTLVSTNTPLTLALDANALLLSWSADAGPFSLHSATNLTPPVAWTPLTNAPVLLGNEWRVTLPAATNGQRFFRLQTP